MDVPQRTLPTFAMLSRVRQNSSREEFGDVEFRYLRSSRSEFRESAGRFAPAGLHGHRTARRAKSGQLSSPPPPARPASGPEHWPEPCYAAAMVPGRRFLQPRGFARAFTRRAFVVSGALASLSASRRALADDLEAIRGRGVLRVGTSGDYAPFSSARGKGFVGLDVELAERLARDLGLKVAFVRFGWPDLTQALKAGLFELALSGITLRGDRAISGRFSRPYAVTSAVALIRREDAARFAAPAALNHAGVRLVVNAGGHLETVARQLFPEANISLTTDNTKLLSPLLAKTADAAISDSAEAHALARSGLSSLGPLTHDRKGILVSANAEQLADWVEHWLREREQDGFLSKLRGRYLGPVPSNGAPLSVEAVLASIQLRCELMPFVGAYKVAHFLPIEDDAQEARVLARIESAARGVGLESPGVQQLYRALMNSAKEIERAPASPASPATPSLDELRAAIRSIDNQLLLELHEALQGGGISIDWAARFQDGVVVDGLLPARKAEIGAALSSLRLTK